MIKHTKIFRNLTFKSLVGLAVLTLVLSVAPRERGIKNIRNITERAISCY